MMQFVFFNCNLSVVYPPSNFLNQNPIDETYASTFSLVLCRVLLRHVAPHGGLLKPSLSNENWYG
jgi:hypothetical protein